MPTALLDEATTLATILVRHEPFDEVLVLEGTRLLRRDVLAVGDAANAEAHGFRIVDARDSHRTRQKFRYPDESTVEDTGRALEGGHAEWTAGPFTPGRDVLVFFRILCRGLSARFAVEVDGLAAGVLAPPARDQTHPWRNCAFTVAGALLAHPTPVFRARPVDTGHDLGLFQVWFYQAE